MLPPFRIRCLLPSEAVASSSSPFASSGPSDATPVIAGPSTTTGLPPRTSTVGMRDGLVRMGREEYEQLIRETPSAALSYHDEEDGEVILIGSALELDQRLQDPPPRLHNSRLEEPDNPPFLSDSLHTFDVKREQEVLETWTLLDRRTRDRQDSDTTRFEAKSTASATAISFGEASPLSRNALKRSLPTSKKGADAKRWASYSLLPTSFDQKPEDLSKVQQQEERLSPEELRYLAYMENKKRKNNDTVAKATKLKTLQAKREIPRRNLSSYLFFISDFLDKVSAENAGLQFGEIAKILADKWMALSRAEMAPYERKAAHDRKRYEDETAAYPAKQERKENEFQPLLELFHKPLARLAASSPVKTEETPEKEEAFENFNVTPTSTLTETASTTFEQQEPKIEFHQNLQNAELGDTQRNTRTSGWMPAPTPAAIKSAPTLSPFVQHVEHSVHDKLETIMVEVKGLRTEYREDLASVHISLKQIMDTNERNSTQASIAAEQALKGLFNLLKVTNQTSTTLSQASMEEPLTTVGPVPPPKVPLDNAPEAVEPETTSRLFQKQVKEMQQTLDAQTRSLKAHINAERRRQLSPNDLSFTEATPRKDSILAGSYVINAPLIADFPKLRVEAQKAVNAQANQSSGHYVPQTSEKIPASSTDRDVHPSVPCKWIPERLVARRVIKYESVRFEQFLVRFVGHGPVDMCWYDREALNRDDLVRDFDEAKRVCHDEDALNRSKQPDIIDDDRLNSKRSIIAMHCRTGGSGMVTLTPELGFEARAAKHVKPSNAAHDSIERAGAENCRTCGVLRPSGEVWLQGNEFCVSCDPWKTWTQLPTDGDVLPSGHGRIDSGGRQGEAQGPASSGMLHGMPTYTRNRFRKDSQEMSDFAKLNKEMAPAERFHHKPYEIIFTSEYVGGYHDMPSSYPHIPAATNDGWPSNTWSSIPSTSWQKPTSVPHFSKALGSYDHVPRHYQTHVDAMWARPVGSPPMSGKLEPPPARWSTPPIAAVKYHPPPRHASMACETWPGLGHRESSSDLSQLGDPKIAKSTPSALKTAARQSLKQKVKHDAQEPPKKKLSKWKRVSQDHFHGVSCAPLSPAKAANEAKVGPPQDLQCKETGLDSADMLTDGFTLFQQLDEAFAEVKAFSKSRQDAPSIAGEPATQRAWPIPLAPNEPKILANATLWETSGMLNPALPNQPDSVREIAPDFLRAVSPASAGPSTWFDLSTNSLLSPTPTFTPTQGRRPETQTSTEKEPIDNVMIDYRAVDESLWEMSFNSQSPLSLGAGKRENRDESLRRAKSARFLRPRRDSWTRYDHPKAFDLESAFFQSSKAEWVTTSTKKPEKLEHEDNVSLQQDGDQWYFGPTMLEQQTRLGPRIDISRDNWDFLPVSSQQENANVSQGEKSVLRSVQSIHINAWPVENVVANLGKLQQATPAENLSSEPWIKKKSHVPPPSAQMSAPVSSLNLEESRCAAQLVEMGFPRERAEPIAASVEGDLGRAIDVLDEDQKAWLSKEKGKGKAVAVEGLSGEFSNAELEQEPMPGAWDELLYG